MREPIRHIERTEQVEAKLAQLITEQEPLRRALPAADMHEPVRTNARMLSEEPTQPCWSAE